MYIGDAKLAEEVVVVLLAIEESDKKSRLNQTRDTQMLPNSKVQQAVVVVAAGEHVEEYEVEKVDRKLKVLLVEEL